jgi:hypothetical protein
MLIFTQARPPLGQGSLLRESSWSEAADVGMVEVRSIDLSQRREGRDRR